MVSKLWLPDKARERLVLPSYVKLDMAFDGADDAKIYDKSRYRSHGDITTATWATGAHGKCLDFDSGNPDYVEIPAAHTQLDFTTEDFSIIIRAYFNSLSNDPQVFNRGKYGTHGYYCQGHKLGYWMLRTQSAGAERANYSASGTITTASWYTLGITRQGTVGKVFVDGVDVTATTADIINPVSCPLSAHIGVYHDASTAPMDGKIEFFRVFGGIALPASTHLAFHNALK